MQRIELPTVDSTLRCGIMPQSLQMFKKVPRSSSLDEANRWCEHNFAACLEYMCGLNEKIASDMEGCSLQQFAESISGLSMSTSFSGIGGAELGVDSTYRMLSSLSSCECTMKHSWSCEKFPESQTELLMMDNRCDCLFTDVRGCLKDSIRNQLMNAAPTMAYEDLLKIFQKDCITDHSYCRIHNRNCKVIQCFLHVAGTECPAFSAQGLHQGVGSGKRVLSWLCWVKQRQLLLEPIICHENVGEFPLELLIVNFSRQYLVHPAMSHILCSSEMGQPYERVRRWSVMIRKDFIMSHIDSTLWSLAVFSDCYEVARRECDIDFSVYWFMSEENGIFAEVWEDEIQWAKERPRWNQDINRPAAERPDRASLEESLWDTLLNDVEIQWKSDYRKLASEGTCSLGQDPMKRPSCNNNKRTLHTFVSKVDMYYGQPQKRWLMWPEMMVVHNFPLIAAVRHWGLVCSFDKRREDFGFGPRSRYATIKQIGNGMSLCQSNFVFSFVICLVALSKITKASTSKRQLSESSLLEVARKIRCRS